MQLLTLAQEGGSASACGKIKGMNVLVISQQILRTELLYILAALEMGGFSSRTRCHDSTESSCSLPSSIGSEPDSGLERKD